MGEVRRRLVLRLNLRVTRVEAGWIARCERRSERHQDQDDQTDCRGTRRDTATWRERRCQPSVQHAVAALSNRVPGCEDSGSRSAQDVSAFRVAALLGMRRFCRRIGPPHEIVVRRRDAAGLTSRARRRTAIAPGDKNGGSQFSPDKNVLESKASLTCLLEPLRPSEESRKESIKVPGIPIVRAG